MVNIIVTDTAKYQLKNIQEYISLTSPANGLMVVNKIIEKIEYAAKYPDQGRPVAICKQGTLRQVNCFKFKIFYCYFEQSLQVIAIYHSAINLDIEEQVVKPLDLLD